MQKMGYEFGVLHAAHPMGMCCCPSACESVSTVIWVHFKLVTLLEVKSFTKFLPVQVTNIPESLNIRVLCLSH
jgi:hypothetical protein